MTDAIVSAADFKAVAVYSGEHVDAPAAREAGRAAAVGWVTFQRVATYNGHDTRPFSQ
jgi:hypothetical protein